MSDHLFLYGTLHPDHAPADVRDAILGLKPVGLGQMTGQLYDLGDYPGAVFDAASQSRVFGQVYDLPTTKLLEDLDAYEEYNPADGVNSLFVREKRAIELDDGERLPCWVYLYNRSPGKAPPIPGGNYFAWSAQHHDASSGTRLTR